MRALCRFLSPKRFWHNIVTHFPLPMLICQLFVISFLLPVSFGNTNVMDGLVLALTVSTAASCIRRRFNIPAVYVWVAACMGLVVGCITGSGDVCYWMQMISIGVCVLVSCWTHRFYLQLLLVPGWFVLCFWITWQLVGFCASYGRGSFFAFLMFLIPFTVAPFLFLGGLPFGDEDFRT